MNSGDEKARNAKGQTTRDDLVLHLLSEGVEYFIEHGATSALCIATQLINMQKGTGLLRFSCRVAGNG